MKKLLVPLAIFCVFVNPIFSQKLFTPEVKRVAVFKNGYAFTYREGEAQDILTFTPVGGENILRITPATEVIGTHTLEEKSREQKQLRYGGSTYDFDLVTVEGAIKIRNIKKDTIEVVLTRNLVGEIIEAGDGGKISRQGLNLQSVNPNSVIKWNLNLPSGEKEIRYTYKIYVRR